ncbi:MAG: putative ORFan [Satyrvirus sp.]|uniref:Putative ORFan n=1 Tax=Satyrvirus sp. TaxID=2487771 RepID=A0A3G5ADD1_9VIRU|nr:MAG: putative ORFan [Satyrvirus sp.]
MQPKLFIEKYLNGPTNYQVTISTTNKLLPLYQKIWSTNTKISYVTDNFIPVAAPNMNIIYIYHQPTKPTKEEQFNLIAYLESNPSIKYIFVGNIDNLSTYVCTKLFRYMLYFPVHSKGKWRWVNCDYISRNVITSVSRKIINQENRKEKTTKPFYLYDYCIFLDMVYDESKIFNFNKKIFRPKQKITKNTIIKYVYVNNNNKEYLLMPNGAKENYENIVNKYKDVIEI